MARVEGIKEAALLLACIVIPIATADVVLIKNDRPSVSNAGGFFFRNYPKSTWTVWGLLTLHLALELKADPLSYIGRRLRR